MRPMRPVIPLGAAVLLAVIGLGLLTGGTPFLPAPGTSRAAVRARPGPATSTARAAAVELTSTPLVSPSPHISSPAPPGAASPRVASEPSALAPGDGPGTDAAVQLLLQQSSPANLPAVLTSTLESLGRRVWLADVTGTGRSRWPDYFTHAGASGYTHVRVQAAIARAEGPSQVAVTLLWAGTSPAGDPEMALPGTVHLTQQTNGTWEPTR